MKNWKNIALLALAAGVAYLLYEKYGNKTAV